MCVNANKYRFSFIYSFIHKTITVLLSHNSGSYDNINISNGYAFAILFSTTNENYGDPLENTSSILVTNKDSMITATTLKQHKQQMNYLELCHSE